MKKLCGLLAVLLTLTNAGTSAANGDLKPTVSDIDSKVILVRSQEGEGLLAYKPVITPNGTWMSLAPTGHYTLPNGQGVDVVQGEVVQGEVVQFQ